MIAPGNTARAAVVALVVIWVLVCGGLGWASRSAVRLDRLEQGEELRRMHEVKMERALSRMEAEVAPILYTERMRSYTQFRGYYVLGPHEVRYRRTAADASDAVEIVSPLRDFRGPDWIILHFQVSDPVGWESPELDDPHAQYALPAGALPRGERGEKATAANWLAALRERHTVASLQQILASELTARRSAGVDGEADLIVQEKIEEAGQGDAAFPDGVNEVARRSERLLALQRELYPEYLCEPEAVARENLGSEVELPPDTDATGCVPTYAPFMTEVWLQLTDDDDHQLALIRQASVENSAYCTLQGLLIDWQRLRLDLLGQIAPLFPRADLQPVFPGDRAGGSSEWNLMHMIPARFIPGESPDVSVGITAGLGKGLAVAWGTTLLGLIAISYGVMKYVAMSQRRMQFVAAVTHELRTPLTSFQLYSDLLGDMQGEDASKRRHYADVLGHESRRLARLVENVLAYSKVGDARTRLDPRPVAAATILDDAVSSGAELCRASGKELVVKNECPDECRIETDRAFVVQILGNLLENACKYSQGAEDGRIWLSAAPGPGGGVTFEVDDAGPGVAARDRRAVFEPFRRGQSASQRGAGGVGLGLSLSRYWARSLGGVLQLKRSPRNGTHLSCFSLTLPPHAPQ